MWGKCQLSTEAVLSDLNSGSDDNIYNDDILDQIEHDIIDVRMNDGDSILANYDNFSPMDCGHIRNMLLTSHSHIIVQILFFLMCGKLKVE